VWKFLGDEERKVKLLDFWGRLKVWFLFWFWVVANRRSCGGEVCRSLSWGKGQKQSVVQCTQGGRVYILEEGMMVEQGEWWEVLEVLRAANNSFQESGFVFCLYLGFVVLFFKSEYPDFGNSKGLQQSIESTRLITEGMGVILCKDSWSSDLGKSMCCIPVFCLIKWNNGVKEIWSCDLCGFEDFEKRVQWAQENEIKVIWPPENPKPLYDEEGNFFVGFWTEFRWPLARASVKFGECICCSIYTCFAFCLFESLFFGDKTFSKANMLSKVLANTKEKLG